MDSYSLFIREIITSKGFLKKKSWPVAWAFQNLHGLVYHLFVLPSELHPTLNHNFNILCLQRSLDPHFTHLCSDEPPLKCSFHQKLHNLLFGKGQLPFQTLFLHHCQRSQTLPHQLRPQGLCLPSLAADHSSRMLTL